MLPFCYEFGLSSGHAPDAAQFLLTATDTFVKEVLSSIFNRTRSNGPGDSGSAGFGSAGASWIQTYRYRRQLVREEEALMRGEVQRDKSGLLPVEAKAASERGPLGLADFRIALEMAESGLATFPTISRSILYGYREGELEEWDDYTYFDDRPRGTSQSGDVEMSGVNGIKDTTALPNGVGSDAMDVDPPEILWEGAEPENMAALDNLLDNCLSLGS